MTETANNKAIIYLILAILLYGVVAGFRATTGVFISSISDLTGLSYGTISGIFGIRNFVFALSCIFFGLLTRKIHVKYILASGAALVTIGFIGSAFSTEYIPLVIFLGFFIGIGAGALCYAIVYAAGEPFFGRKNAAIFAGILSASQGFFNILITPFVEILGSSSTGLTTCFVVLGAITTCLIPLCFFFRKKKIEKPEENNPSEDTSILAPLKYMVRQPIFYLLALAYVVYGICNGGMLNHLFTKSTVLSNDTSFSTLLVMIYGFSIILGPILGGIVVSKVKNIRIVVSVILFIWLLISVTSFLVPMSDVGRILVVFGMGLFASSLMPTLSILTLRSSPVSLFASILPLIITFEYFGTAIDSWFGGLCFDMFGSFKLSFLLTFVLCGIVIVLFLIAAIIYGKKTRSSVRENKQL